MHIQRIFAYLCRRSKRLLTLCFFLIMLVYLIGFIDMNFLFECGRDLLINERYIGHDVNVNRASINKNTVNYLKSTTVTFFILGKNVEKNLEIMLSEIVDLGSMFKEYNVLFIDGNSSDATKQIFDEVILVSSAKEVVFKSAPSDNLLETQGKFINSILPREGRIATARNIGLRELSRMTPSDYTIMVDGDILGWDANSLVKSFDRRDTWDVVCSNGVMAYGVFRDVYAFRTEELITNHHIVVYDFAVNNVDPNFDTSIPAVKSRKRQHDINTQVVRSMMRSSDSMIRVNSCFSGLAIYKSKILGGCEYSYRHVDNGTSVLDCEHVLFHECIRAKNNARIYANPNMKLWYGHSIFDKPFSKILKATLKVLFGDSVTYCILYWNCRF